MLSLDQRSNLLRLYLDWPKKIENDLDREANEFYLWLTDEFEREELYDLAGGLSGVKEFLKSSARVLGSARYLKDHGGGAASNAREDVRIPVNTQLYFMVYDCQTDQELEGTILRGVVLDMAPNGIRIETSMSVPIQTIISMAVVQIGSGISQYHLMGEVRWLTQQGELSHIGVSIYELEDAQKWQDFYFMMSTST